MTNKFTYISLFSGIGGFEQALDSLGGTCVFASEFDKFASKAYESIYGGDVLHGDITKINEKDVPDHDLLVGGFPCQAFSVAGRRKGLEDARGTLFFDIARIAKEKQPKALLLENVKGLVNHDKGNTLDLMIRTLNDIGYVPDFDVLNSKYFDVPQNRERIFIVAIRKDLIDSEPFNEEATKGQTIVPRGKRRIGEWADVYNFDYPKQAEVTTRLRDILEPVVDEKYYLDEEKTARLVAQLEDIERDSCEINQIDNIDQVNRKRNNPQTGRIYGPGGMSPALSTMQGGGLEPKIAEAQTPVAIGTKPRYRIRKLTPLECFRLQGFPDSVHQTLVDAGISDSQRYKMAGNAVTVYVVRAIGERLIPMIAD